MRERICTFDFIRIIACFAVILIHITSVYVPINNFAYIINQMMRFAIPIFIILSGASIYYSESEKEEIGFVSFVVNRIKKVLIPYTLWTLSYMLYDYIENINGIFSREFVYEFLRNFLLGKGHLYFVVIIFQIYLLYPFIKKGFQKGFSKVILLGTFILTTYFQLAIYLVRWYIYILPKSIVTYGYILFPSWIFFFVFGMYFINKRQEWDKHLLNNIISIAITWFLSLILLIIDSKITSTYGSSVKPTVMIYGIVSFIFLYCVYTYIEKYLSKSIHNVIYWLSTQSFFVYLSHILILDLIKSYSYIFGINNNWHHIEGMLLLFILVSGVSFVLAYIINLLPFTSIGGGKKHNARTPNKYVV